jgi:hypothetical protein
LVVEAEERKGPYVEVEGGRWKKPEAFFLAKKRRISTH